VFEVLEYRTLLSGAAIVNSTFDPATTHPTSSSAPAGDPSNPSSGNTVNTAPNAAPTGTGTNNVNAGSIGAIDSTPAPNQITPTAIDTAANSTPATINPGTPPLAAIEMGQAPGSVIAFSSNNVNVPAVSPTNPTITGTPAVASNVNNVDGNTAVANVIGSSRSPWNADNKGGSNVPSDASGTGNLDRFWSNTGQQIVTGGIPDILF